MTEAFPLHWPDGWPRTEPHKRKWSLPGGRTADWNQVMGRLEGQLSLMQARHVVISTNQPIRRDGRPYAAPRRIEDPGAAVYFTLKGRQMAMAQDAYELLVDNIRSLAIAIEHMRGLERHGGGHMMERAFRGFEALPAPAQKRHWHEVFSIPPGKTVTLEEIERAYRVLAKLRHPDVGGSDAAMAELNLAHQEAREALS